MPLPAILFETDRLICRPFEAADYEILLRLNSNQQVYKYMGDGAALSGDEVRLWIDRSRANISKNGTGTGAVIEKASALMIGFAGFVTPEEGRTEIIYAVAPERWREGFGREIVTAQISLAVRRGINPLFATVDPENAASIALLKRLGFQRVARKKDEDGLDTDVYQRAIA